VSCTAGWLRGSSCGAVRARRVLRVTVGVWECGVGENWESWFGLYVVVLL
jgi:hypothetical protein